ncbi:MAG: IS1-like element transposase [Paludibacteraceae bacterium]
MKHYQSITCPHCNGDNISKAGKSENGSQRWLCNSCKKRFMLEYRYTARKPGIKEKIIELTLNSSGVRDIERTLKVHRDTVTSTLKKNAANEPLLSHYRRKITVKNLGSGDKVQ